MKAGFGVAQQLAPAPHCQWRLRYIPGPRRDRQGPQKVANCMSGHAFGFNNRSGRSHRLPEETGHKDRIFSRCTLRHQQSSVLSGGTMAGPNLISNRRFSAQTRLRLQLVFARASEALADTYQAQAAEFVRRLKTRLPVEEALQRYFQQVGVPAALEETVRARALISLAGLIENTPRLTVPAIGWTAMRPDHLLGAVRRRVQYIEETNLECRLAGSISDEAVAGTHVRMALETVSVLAEENTPDEAIMQYVRAFNLSSIDAQVIFRSAMAMWAELHPLSGEAHAGTRPGMHAAPPPKPTLELRPRSEFGLRVMV
jgi:hypothetical protein